MQGIFLEVTDMQKIAGYQTYNGAWNYYNKVRIALGINRRRITIEEFCKCEDLNKDEVLQKLNEPIKKFA